MKKLQSILFGLGIIAIFISPFFYLLAWHYQTKFAKYREKGIERNASVANKNSRSSGKTSNYYVKITYFDADIRENGKFYMEEVDVNAKVWKKVREGDKIPILILKDTPDKPLLKSSTLPENHVPFEKYNTAYFTFMLGSTFCIIGLFLYKMNNKRP